MPYTTTPCPNCGADIKLDENLETGYCMYCGSEIKPKADSVSLHNLVKLIRKDLKRGKNRTTEFRTRLKSALDLAPNNKELYSLYESEIWNATIKDTTLESYTGNAQNIIIPEFIDKIADLAFVGCKELRQLTIPKGVTYIGENIFSVNSNFLTIKTHASSCGARYAIAHSIGLIELEATNITNAENKDIQQLTKFHNQVSAINKKGNKQIAKHYDDMLATIKNLTTNMLTLGKRNLILFVDALMIVAYSFILAAYLSDIRIGAYFWISNIITILINIPLFINYRKTKLLSNSYKIKVYKQLDLQTWNKNYTQYFTQQYQKFDSNGDMRYWNKSDINISKEITFMNKLTSKLRSLNPKIHITIHNFYGSIPTPPNSFLQNGNLKINDMMTFFSESFIDFQQKK